jgi:CBS domain-containing protein
MSIDKEPPGTPPGPQDADPVHTAAAATAVRTAPPSLVSALHTVTRSRLERVGEQAPLPDVASRLLMPHIDVVVVCNADGAVAGVITETMLIHQLAFGNADVFTTRAQEVMQRDFNTCSPAQSLPEVMAMMQVRALTHVLVVEAGNMPIGVLNVRDGLRALLAAGNYEEALLRNYVMGLGYQ